MSIEEFSNTPEDQGAVQLSQPAAQRIGSGIASHGALNPATVPHDHIYEDVKAAAAVAGIPPSEIADKCEFLEGELSKWLAADDHTILRPKGWYAALFVQTLTRPQLTALAGEPLRILRLEVRELALALATEMVEKKTAENRAGIYSEYCKVRDQLADIQDFLKQHFNDDLEVGRARGQGLLDICKVIMLSKRA